MTISRASSSCIQWIYFQSSVLVEKLTGHNTTEDISFFKAVEEFSETAMTYPPQRNIQEELDNSAIDNLLRKQSSIREKAHLHSLSLPQSGAWLSAAPIPALGLLPSSNEIRVALKYRLGSKLYESERKCPFCKSGSLDVIGDHTVSCHGRGHMISCHDRIRDKITSACSGALFLTPICEQKSLLPDNNSRPGDIFLPVWIAGQPAASEVTVTPPLQSSLIINASEKTAFALSAADDRKYEQYAQNCSEVGIQFIHLAFESFGGFSGTVRKTLKQIATLSGNRKLQQAGLPVALSRLSQSVSVTAICGSASMLLARDARL